MRFPILASACALVLAFGATASEAQSARSRCDRECLRSVADQYLTALAARDAARLPLARNVRYTENGQVLDLRDGLWGTANAVGKYRQIFADSRGDEVGLFATMRENDAPVLLATRLKLQRGKITEIESIVSRPGAQFAPGTEPGWQRLERLGSNPLWEAEIAPAERMSRAELIATANKYFVGLEKNDGKGEYPFTVDCHRLENGNQTTGNPEMARLADEAEAHPERQGPGRPTAFGYRLMSYPCKEQFELGYMKMVDRIRDRRFPIVDVERGAVFTLAFFDHSGTVHEVTTTDGKTHSIGLRAPFTWELAEAFRIEKGNIRVIEAVLTQSPYGMKPNWPK